MFRRRPQLGFPRKVVACYLLFCLGAVCWLSIGLLVTSHRVLSSRTINSCISRLGKTAAAIEIEYVRHGSNHFFKILDRAKSEARLAYASVVASDGTILAHTDPRRVGQTAETPSGTSLRWGDVSGVRYLDQEGQGRRQYRVPLVASKVPFGSLQIEVVEPSLLGTLAEVAHMAPLAVLVPLVLVIGGAVILSRLSKQMDLVDQQLRKLALAPAGSELSIEPLAARDATTLGWNRLADLVKNLQNSSGEGDLDSRLSQAVASRQENDLTNILQNLSDGVAVTDMEGRITFANRAVTALLDADENEGNLNGTLLQSRLLEEIPSLKKSPLLDPQSANRAVVSESDFDTGKTNRVLRIARQPLQGVKQAGQVWTLRDVTQQKLAAKMRDQFIDTATHELRTPLSNIKAYAETLATCDNIDVEEQKEFFNIINSETTRLARFVDDLLSISSMEVGSLSAERQKVETARLFAEVEAKVMPVMKQKNIVFESRLPAKMPELQLDKEKMVAVMVNLLGNAAKYTPEGGHVSLKVKIDEQQLQIAIEDSGVGISAEELPKVFEKFFRSADPRVQAEVGTGLGLSLAREVVRMHSGELTVESQLDKGSTFLITIPLE